MKLNNFESIFILRQIVRQPVKSVLTVMIAMFFVIALGFLQTAIYHTQLEIDHMYDTTIVVGEITQADPIDTTMTRLMGNTITNWTIRYAGQLVENEYIEAGHEFAVIVPAAEDNTLPVNWYEIAGIDVDGFVAMNMFAFTPIIGISNAGTPMTEYSYETDYAASDTPHRFDDPSGFGAQDIDFAEGFAPASFVFTSDSLIPLILCENTMSWHGLELGSMAYIGFLLPMESWAWVHMPAVVVGTHDRQVRLQGFLTTTAAVPLAALEYSIGEHLGYTLLRFEIDPALNREMPRIHDELTGIIESRDAGWLPLRLTLHDAYLRMVVAPMEQNLSLLRLLFPVAIAVTIIAGFGLSILLMLQNAKVTAIMRVLGATRKRTGAMLTIEHVAICLTGLILGIVVTIVMGGRGGIASFFGFAGLYFSGALVGGICGASIVTKRSPLELLQVKE